MPKAKPSKDKTPSFTYLIEKKREGGEFADEEIRNIVDAILDEEMPEYQQAAWVMATFCIMYCIAFKSWPDIADSLFISDIAKNCIARHDIFY